MQAVILAAGKSTRAYPLTLTRPKPLLKAANKTLLECNLDNLNGIADEAIVVIGYKKNMIKGCFGDKYKKIKIKYAEQKKQLGTAHAVSVAEPYVKDRFILMMGDNIYSREDIKNCLKHRYSILTTTSDNPQNFGVVIERKGILEDFVEKPGKYVSSLVNTALYSLDKKIFKCIKEVKKSERSEFELPDAIKLLAREHKVHCVKSKRWLPIGYALDILKADRALRKNKSIVGKKSKIHGNVENSSIGDNCMIYGNIRNSLIMDKTIIYKNSIVEDSVIGENVHFSGKIYGSVIADNVKAENVVVKNCRIWPNRLISNKTVNHDIA